MICCKGRIAYGIEAAALSGEFAERAPQTRRVVIDLGGVEMIDAAGLGALISVALMAQESQCSVTLAAPAISLPPSHPVDKRHDAADFGRREHDHQWGYAVMLSLAVRKAGRLCSAQPSSPTQRIL